MERAAPALVVGLMSGTSCDGVDAALIEVQGVAPPKLRVTVHSYITETYEPTLRARLLNLNTVETSQVDEICRCNFLLAQAFGRAVRSVCKLAQVSLEKVCLIGSHGHTIHHLPLALEGSIGTPSTLQIGDPAVLSEETGITTVSGFRSRDMAVGGEGAPLVPLIDFFLFSHPTELRIAQNIGGIANLTVLPPGSRPNQVLAFDTGPGNMVIDALAKEFLNQTADFDGSLAAQGQPNHELLSYLMQHTFFSLKPPKSTGRETFGQSFAQRLLAEARRRNLNAADTIATATALTANSIIDQINRYVRPQLGTPAKLIVSGGGAHNPVLMEMLRSGLREIQVQTSEAYGVPVDAKEAIAFALLAWRTWWTLPGNLTTATGAAKPVVLGSITPGANWPPPVPISSECQQ